MSIKINIKKEDLEQLYIVQRLSAKQIAIKYNCSNVAILNWLRRFGYGDVIKVGYPKGRKNIKLSGENSPTKRPEVRKKMSDNHANVVGNKNPNYGKGYKILGSKNPNWQGGLDKKDYSYKFTSVLKEQIRKRDDYICKCCNMTEKEHLIRYSEKLHVHHIDYDKQNCKDSNLITLCLKCNLIANFNRDYWYAYFMYIREDYNA